MTAEFQVLADYKTAQGLPTVVATTEFIQANYRNGADIQETIRMFIRDAYEKWGMEYVLLGGDSDILPPRYVDNTFYPTNGYTSIPGRSVFRLPGRQLERQRQRQFRRTGHLRRSR